MNMPDGWEKMRHTRNRWKKGGYTVFGWLGAYTWLEVGVSGVHGGFPDPVSCAVACELATGGCTDGHN